MPFVEIPPNSVYSRAMPKKMVRPLLRPIPGLPKPMIKKIAFVPN